jgi:hypothetical protein
LAALAQFQAQHFGKGLQVLVFKRRHASHQKSLPFMAGFVILIAVSVTA